jgi:hypothetical protein
MHSAALLLRDGHARADVSPSRVHRTCLCLRYVQNSFSADQESTIQATYLDKRLNVGKRSVKLMIWDTAGQERFHALGVSHAAAANVSLGLREQEADVLTVYSALS